MSLSAAIIDALLANGVTVDQLAAAVKADIVERASEEAGRIEAKREGNRDRQRRKRDRDNAKSRDVTPVTRDRCDTPPNEDNLTPPELPTKPSGLEPKPKKHRLPADWEPRPFRPGGIAALTIIRWEPGRMERELAKFRNHHIAAGSRFEDWQAAWSKWVNNSEDFQRGRHDGQTVGKSQAAYMALNPGDEPF